MEHIDAARVQEQVKRICASEEFTAKPLLCGMLSYIVTEFLEGRGELIKGYSIATDVFGRDDDFDPDQNSLVRIHAGRLRRQLKLYYLEAGTEDPIVIQIPKGRYIPRISTTFQEKRKNSDDSSTSLKHKKPKLAVVPFQNLTEKPEYDHIATGLSSELSGTLSGYDDFSIIGINPGRNTDQSQEEFLNVLKQNDVNFVIEGSLQEFDGLLLFRTRVIDMADNAQIGTDKFKFDREKNNLFDNLEKLTIKIANYIAGEFGYINLRRRKKIVANNPASTLEQDLLMKYYHTAYILKEEVAIEFHQSVFRALSQEPDSALINSLAGEIYGRMYTMDLTGSEEALEKFEYYIEKAYSLDPTHHRVISALVMKLFVFNERERFMQLLEAYKDRFPKTPLRLGALALGACLFGEWEIGLSLLDEVFDNNINIPEYFHGLRSTYHYKHRDYKQALEAARKYQMPNVYWAPFYRAICHAQLGEITEAKMEVQDLLAIRPDFKTRGRYLLGILIKDEALLEHMCEGLEKAGLQLA